MVMTSMMRRCEVPVLFEDLEDLQPNVRLKVGRTVEQELAAVIPDAVHDEKILSAPNRAIALEPLSSIAPASADAQGGLSCGVVNERCN